MSKVLGDVLQLIGYFTGQGWLVAVGRGVSVYQQRRARKQAERRARDAYNASLTDRLEMVDVLPDAPRTLVMGRCRTVEGVRRRWTSGANDEKLTLIVSFAGHEIDGFETWYADDVALTLDGSGYVQTEPFAKVRRTAAKDTLALNGSGAGTKTLAHTPLAGSVSVFVLSGGFDDSYALGVTVDGDDVSVTGGPASGSVQILYDYNSAPASLLRIRPYLGTAAQNVGADLAAEYPGKITATDRFAGIALAVVDMTYDPDVFPQGYPNITAVLRGAKLYDPRLDSTQTGGSGTHRVDNHATWQWTENLALQAYHYARWSNGWAVPADEIRTADVMAAADVCAASTDFSVTPAGGGSPETVTLPRYSGGIVIPSDADPAAMMDEIVEAMAGRHGWAGGQWRLRAGAMAAPVFSVTPRWLVQAVGPGGETQADPVMRLTNGVPRHQRFNRISGRCVDPAQRWQVLPFPAMADPVRIAAKGELASEVEYLAVNHIAQAQNLARIAIRQAHAGLAGVARCGLQAWDVELFDVGTLDLPRFGFEGKTVEATSWRWHPREGVQLGFEEITAAIFDPSEPLNGRDPAPNSTLRRPWDVETIEGVSVTSGTEALTDGSILTRTRVTWTAATGASVRQAGLIEVQYVRAEDDLPAGEWATWTEPGTATEAVIPGLITGGWYRFRVRAVQQLPLVRGDWSATAVHQVAAPPAAGGATFVVAFEDADGVFFSTAV